eukprot:7950587-Pyramimonas_sp.AAC.2
MWFVTIPASRRVVVASSTETPSAQGRGDRAVRGTTLCQVAAGSVPPPTFTPQLGQTVSRSALPRALGWNSFARLQLSTRSASACWIPMTRRTDALPR